MSTTKEQDVVRAKEQARELNESYHASLKEYLRAISGTEDDVLMDALLDVQRKGNNFFNFYEEFVGNSDLLGAHKSAYWAQGFAEDCLSVLKVMPQHYELMQAGFDKLGQNISATPNSTAFANMQRIAKKYLNGDVVSEVEESFVKGNLPIYGFQNEEKRFMSHKLQLILSFVFGVVFVLLMIATAFMQPNPTSYQYWVFRVVLALAGAGVVAVLPGFIEVKFGNWLRAGGALAIFAVIYGVAPAALDNTAVPQVSPATSIEQTDSTAQQ